MPLRVHFLDEGTSRLLILCAFRRSCALALGQSGLQKMFGAGLPNHLTLTHGGFDELEHVCKQRMTMASSPEAGREARGC